MIVITGGAGFLGSNLLAGLEAMGIGDVVVCDRFGKDDKWRNIAKREVRDIIAPEELFDYLDAHAKEVEAIFHLCTVSYTTEKDTDYIVETNFALSRRLWKWCAQHDARFLYTSSYATFGHGHSLEDFSDDESPEALAKLKPLNPFGWTKHLFDRRVARVVAHKSEPLPPQWVGLKLFNVYGPNEYHKGADMSVVAKMYPFVSAGAAAKLYHSNHPDYKDGEQIRDFTWVDDCVDVMLWFYKHKEKNGLYNVGSGQARTFVDMADALFESCGKRPNISFVEMPQELVDKYQYYTHADISKLRAAGYDKPMTLLEDGIKKFVDEYLSKEDKYR